MIFAELKGHFITTKIKSWKMNTRFSYQYAIKPGRKKLMRVKPQHNYYHKECKLHKQINKKNMFEHFNLSFLKNIYSLNVLLWI